VQTDMRDLQKLGVGATPAFFINGRFMSGAMPLENFVTLIDEELKKANERIQQGTAPAQYYQQWVVDKGLKTLEAPKQ
jgi:predicted DsbA family dithiol-disulfide isomerase